VQETGGKRTGGKVIGIADRENKGKETGVLCMYYGRVNRKGHGNRNW
jgi:hypothetical protein